MTNTPSRTQKMMLAKAFRFGNRVATGLLARSPEKYDRRSPHCVPRPRALTPVASYDSRPISRSQSGGASAAPRIPVVRHGRRKQDVGVPQDGEARQWRGRGEASPARRPERAVRAAHGRAGERPEDNGCGRRREGRGADRKRQGLRRGGGHQGDEGQELRGGEIREPTPQHTYNTSLSLSRSVRVGC